MARGDGRQHQWGVLVLPSLRTPHDRPAQRQYRQSRLNVRIDRQSSPDSRILHCEQGRRAYAYKSFGDGVGEERRTGERAGAGLCATEMTLKIRERPELFNVWLDMTPMGRIGEPFEI